MQVGRYRRSPGPGPESISPRTPWPLRAPAPLAGSQKDLVQSTYHIPNQEGLRDRAAPHHMHRKLPLATENEQVGIPDLGNSHPEWPSATTPDSVGPAILDGRGNQTDWGYVAQTALARSRAMMKDDVALLNSRTLALGSLDDETGQPPPSPAVRFPLVSSRTNSSILSHYIRLPVSKKLQSLYEYDIQRCSLLPRMGRGWGAGVRHGSCSER